MKKLLAAALLALLTCAPALVCQAADVKSALLMNLSTGRILYAKNPDTPVPPASLTKIMTMFLAMDAIRAGRLSPSEKVLIPREAAQTGGSAMHLAPGEKTPVSRLLAGMAVSSGNDAAMAIASRLGGVRRFVTAMNARARALGMKNTRFKNPSGLPAAGQKTTARDLMLLCRAYLKRHPQAVHYHKMTWFLHKGMAARNTNPMLGRLKGVDGLKTGWTVASGYNLILTARRGKTRLLAIILGARSKAVRDAVAMRLIETGFSRPNSKAKALASK